MNIQDLLALDRSEHGQSLVRFDEHGNPERVPPHEFVDGMPPCPYGFFWESAHGAIDIVRIRDAVDDGGFEVW